MSFSMFISRASSALVSICMHVQKYVYVRNNVDCRELVLNFPNALLWFPVLEVEASLHLLPIRWFHRHHNCRCCLWNNNFLRHSRLPFAHSRWWLLNGVVVYMWTIAAILLHRISLFGEWKFTLEYVCRMDDELEMLEAFSSSSTCSSSSSTSLYICSICRDGKIPFISVECAIFASIIGANENY